MWAILSGIEGNLAAYEAVLADIKRRKNPVEELYILGDVIAANTESNRIIQRLRNPKPRELKPQVCLGWWEEQLLILHGLGRSGEPTALIDIPSEGLRQRYGVAMTKTLWEAIDQSHLQWLRSLDFGFFELDCLLIHGSTVGVEDELTPDTPPVQMIDRLLRMEANYLFCGRSGLAFQYEIAAGSLTSQVTTLDRPPQPRTATLKPRQIIGVGNVGRIPGHATYTLYQPSTGKIQFQTVHYGTARGFQS